MFKFIHAADIHLDSPLRGLEHYDGAPVAHIRGASRQALVNLVDLAIAEQVAFVLFAGDLYDGEWRDYNTGLFFAAQMTKLREVGIKVGLITGNHDAASQVTRYLRLPDNVTIFSVHQPQTVHLEACDVALHGQGFEQRAVTVDLSTAYPQPDPYLFNIGLLHTSLNGREGHESYAPCSIEGLRSKGYDYWALGHVHTREVIHQEPWIIFPGNIQGRHVRESGAKGCTLVTVQNKHVIAAEHRELDVLRWHTCRVDVSGAQTADSAMDRVHEALENERAHASDHPFAIRVRLTGACQAHGDLAAHHEHWTNEIRTMATDISNGLWWIEQVRLETRTHADVDALCQRDDALGALLRGLMQGDTDAQLVSDVESELSTLQRKLPMELRSSDAALDLRDPHIMRQAIEEATHLLVTHLLSMEHTQ